MKRKSKKAYTNQREHIVFNDKQIEEVEKLARTLNCQQIADYMGIGIATFRRIRHRDEDVMIAYKKGKAGALDFVASKLMEKIIQGDTASIIFYLKTQGGWSETKSTDIDTDTENILKRELPVIVLNTCDKNNVDET
jgi:hypothetical protein